VTQSVGVGSNPYALAAADFDGSQRLGLAVHPGFRRGDD
jgi:hypothetical protein